MTNKFKANTLDVVPPRLHLFSTIGESVRIRFLIVLQLLLFAWQFSPQLCTNGDNAKYLTLGKALIEGRGYRNIGEPEAPVEPQYPILFPALLGFAQLFSDNYIFPKIIIAIIGSLAVVLCYLLYRTQPNHLLWPLLTLVTTSGLIAEYSLILMSEIPYLFFSLLALYLREKSLDKPSSGLIFWLTVTVSVMPVNCRSIGLAFSAAWIIDNIWSKHYRLALMHAVGLICTIAIFRSFVPSDPYFVQLIQRNSYDPDAGFVTPAEMGTRILQNLSRYGGILVRGALIPFAHNLPPFVGRILSTLSLGCIIIGWLRAFFIPGKRFVGIYLLLYAGILCMWQPQWAGERFLVSIIPFLYLMLLYGLDALVSFFDPSVPRPPGDFFSRLSSGTIAPSRYHTPLTVWAAAAVIMAFNLDYGLVNSGKRKEPTPDWRNFYSCADWVRIHTPPNAVVMSRKPELFYLRSKRKGLVYPFTHDVEKVIATIEEKGATHVVHDNFAWSATTARYLYPAIAAHPERFKIVYALKDPDTFVLEVLPK